MTKEKSKKANLFLKVVGSSTILTVATLMIILIPALMILSFFGVDLTSGVTINNMEYAEQYRTALNKNLKNGYVSLDRILYFYLEYPYITVDQLYMKNQDITNKTSKNIVDVCTDPQLKNLVACTSSNIATNINYLDDNSKIFNLPLKQDTFSITSFYNEYRIVYGENDIHRAWDFAAPANTDIFSMCNGTVERVHFTQATNEPFHQSNNKTGNNIDISCVIDNKKYLIKYVHLYPNSSVVNVGDTVTAWQKIATVGTTGYSTGNHLHLEIYDELGTNIDAMKFIDLNSVAPTPEYELQ